MEDSSTLNRRELCGLLSAFVAMAALPAEGQLTANSTEPVLSKPLAFSFDKLPVTKNESGEARQVLEGVLPTGERVDLHETTLLPGHMPHAAHQHRHSELILVREGTLELDSDGARHRVGPGGVLYAASNILHGVKNVGDTTANYFVIAIGRESAVVPA